MKKRPSKEEDSADEEVEAVVEDTHSSYTRRRPKPDWRFSTSNRNYPYLTAARLMAQRQVAGSERGTEYVRLEIRAANTCKAATSDSLALLTSSRGTWSGVALLFNACPSHAVHGE